MAVAGVRVIVAVMIVAMIGVVVIVRGLCAVRGSGQWSVRAVKHAVRVIAILMRMRVIVRMIVAMRVAMPVMIVMIVRMMRVSHGRL